MLCAKKVSAMSARRWGRLTAVMSMAVEFGFKCALAVGIFFGR